MARGKSKNADTRAGNGNGANLGFEAQMFLAADKLRKHLEPSDDKHVALGLIFLKYISNTLEAKQSILDKPVRLLQSLLFHLRTYVNERSIPELAA